MLVVAAVWIATLTSDVGGVGGPRALSDFGLMFAALGAGVACFIRARGQQRREQLFWRLIGAFALSWGIGQTAWTWYEVVQGREVPFPSLADVGYLLAVPFAAAAMFMLPSGSGTAVGRARTLIDGTMIAGSALLTSWVFVLRIAFEQDGSLFSHTISLLYPIGDVIIVTMVLYAVLRSRQNGLKTSAPILLIGAGLLGFAFSDSAFTYLTATNTYSSGSLIDIGWFCGFTFILLAAAAPEDRRVPKRRGRDEAVGDVAAVRGRDRGDRVQLVRADPDRERHVVRVLGADRDDRRHRHPPGADAA
jgi:hypothetical protein